MFKTFLAEETDSIVEAVQFECWEFDELLNYLTELFVIHLDVVYKKFIQIERKTKLCTRHPFTFSKYRFDQNL